MSLCKTCLGGIANTSQSLDDALAELATYVLTFGVRNLHTESHIRADNEADLVKSEQRGC
jgi:hypothetical protein